MESQSPRYVLGFEVVGEKGGLGEHEVILVLPLVGLVPAIAYGAWLNYRGIEIALSWEKGDEAK